MKKKFVLTAGVVFISVALFAQNDIAIVSGAEVNLKKEKALADKEHKAEKKAMRKEEVSVLSKDAFYSDFGSIPVIKWERRSIFDEASFMKDGHVFTAYYDNDFKLVGTTTQKLFTDLPEKAQKYISNKYKDFNVEEVFLFDDNEANETDMMMYGTEFDDADNYFVALSKGTDEVVLKVDMNGETAFFKQIKY